jgi:uncharacterized BrkB/YihY/UPF0761 family membrane protein
VRDPEFRRRLLNAGLLAMLIAAVFGIPAGVIAYLLPTQAGSPPVSDALFLGGNVAAVVFWAAFLLLSFTVVYRTNAMRDMDRRVRMAEDLFRRSRPRR